MKILYGPANSADIYYRAGFDSDVDCIYTEKGKKRTLYVPGFEYLRAKKEAKVRVEPLKDMKKLLRSFKGPSVIDWKFPYAMAKHLKKKKTVYEHFPTRRVKTKDEIKKIKQSQNIGRKAIKLIENIVKKSKYRNGKYYYKNKVLTSEFLKTEARNFLISKDCDCPELIVASGKQSSEPHNRGSGPIKKGALVIDIFPQSGKTRYHGDMTRTIILDDKEAEKMLKAVKKVHDECVKMCKPGVRASKIHNHAVKRLKGLGYESNKEEGLIHALGHGVGLDIHEWPSISPKNKTILKKGMVVTIEPGLYYKTGVRWENIVVVGKKPVIL